MGGVVDDDLSALVTRRLVLHLARVRLVAVDPLPLLRLEHLRAEAALVLVLAVVTLALIERKKQSLVEAFFKTLNL
jgi:maleate cis-trans isomerase